MDAAIYIMYKPNEVTANLNIIRKRVGPGGSERSAVSDNWESIEAKTKLPGKTPEEYCDALLAIALVRDKKYTTATRGFTRALGITTLARKAYQRALLTAVNGVTRV